MKFMKIAFRHSSCSKLLFFIQSVILLSLPISFVLLSGCATGPARVEAPKGEYVWPIPPATPKIKWVSQWRNRYDFGKPNELLEMLIGKERLENLRRPNGIVTDAVGNIYVADSEMHIVFVFDMEKKALGFLGMGTLQAPVGLTMNNKDGVIYVSDTRQNKVYGINTTTGDVVLALGGPAEFRQPSGLVFNEEHGLLYVADTQHHTVKVFDTEGRPLFTIGGRGNAPGEFNFPSYLAIDNKNRLYVVDSFNFRVQIFDVNGQFLKKFGKMGDASGYFSRPAGIGVDSDGNIYVVDTSFNNFQIFNDEGKLLLWVGNSGTKPGEFYLPSGLYIDDADRIYVSDTFNRRVQVFQYLKETK